MSDDASDSNSPGWSEGDPLEGQPGSHGNGSEDRDEYEYGPEPSSKPVEAGTPSVENAVFVLLGALAMALVMVRLASILIG